MPEKNPTRLALLLALAAFAFHLSARASEAGTNALSSASWDDEVVRRLHGFASVDYRNGFTLRGICLVRGSTSVQSANLSWDGGAWGRFGGTALSVAALDLAGSPIAERRWCTVTPYRAYYGQCIRLADDWTLEAQAFREWLMFVGCVGNIPTLGNWGGYLGLKNPYVTPYCFYRWADQGQHWSYWQLGMRRPFRPLEKLALVPLVFFDFGDGRHLNAQYKINPNRADGSFSAGLMAMNLMLSAEYELTKWLSLTAFVHEFITLNGDGRDALEMLPGENTVKDMTLFGVGVKLVF